MTKNVGLFVAASGAMFAACTAPGGPNSVATVPPYDGGTKTVSSLTCSPVTSAEPLPARPTLSETEGSNTGNIYYTADLFDRFQVLCGRCHVEGSQGNYTVSSATFRQKVGQLDFDRIVSNDPALMMPPQSAGGTAWDERGPNDPVVEFAGLLDAWIAQGRSANSFIRPAADGPGPATDYTVTPDLAARMTNIGTCVPSSGMIGISTQTMDGLDELFASATQETLPEYLSETDLLTLDSETLARSGVVSFAPAYPLWSDGSGKMRHVRVPRGQTVTFDKQTQQFRIPTNTRFYKTFLKKIVDASGNETHRKIETRLIVARPAQACDGTDGPLGDVCQKALFGTYLWNADETSATLWQGALRNGKPFRDLIIRYTVDEPRAKAIADTNPRNLNYALERLNSGVVRHYAIPGSERCIQCHMGSPGADFVLGFTPLQLARHPLGTNGVFEPAEGDELTQLQRLIDYGVISGMTSPADVLPLHQSQGTRTPRNDHELKAQGYMLGNCAHCHNPTGFPSIKEPALREVLNFMPGPTGGIFRFGLETFSPVRFRGPNQDIRMPYITPSLRDLPADGLGVVGFCPTNPTGGCGYADPAWKWIDAPWRSLIYRNVDTPFDYVHHDAIFPHMPMNTSGHDCRAAQIMGEWMVSIPAVLKNLGKDSAGNPRDENALPNEDGNGKYTGKAPIDDPQPYQEVGPGDNDYPLLKFRAQQRLEVYQKGPRYNFCPDTSDIFDPAIQDDLESGQAVTTHSGVVRDPNDKTRVLMPDTGVPIHTHFVELDLTEESTKWAPRRPDWPTPLVEQRLTAGDAQRTLATQGTLREVVAALPEISVTPELRRMLAEEEVPFGLWDQKASCDLTDQRTVGSYTTAERPLWMDVGQQDPNARVYRQSYGAAVFNSICFNCHGPQADSKGLLADAINLMTGGDARVANFRDGMFGPANDPGANRQSVFGEAAESLGITADDLGARYMAFMALGGTSKRLPIPLLTLVGAAPILGKARPPKVEQGGSADMLKLGFELCTHILGTSFHIRQIDAKDLFGPKGRIDFGAHTALIDQNGDAEMWLRLCALNNRPVVRAIEVTASAIAIRYDDLWWGDTYPPGADVMDHRGRRTPFRSSDQGFLMCALQPSKPDDVQKADQFLATNLVPGAGGSVAMPYCPPEMFAAGKLLEPEMPLDDRTAAKKWAARGAANAALAVFLHLDRLVKGQVEAQPPFNHCELRTSGASR